jgi:magnesium and cobalt transporter
MTRQHSSPKLSKLRSWLDRFASLIGREPQDKEELRTVLRSAEDRDVLSSEILGMIERILQVSDMQVREVMVPKSQMVVIEEGNTFDEVLPIVIHSGHSRFPVLDTMGKDVIGFLLAKDLLKYVFNEQDSFQLNTILRPAVFTSQNKRLDVLLREFRINRTHLAIVLDEYGNVAGLITIEDVLEQIVGEIEDEYDIGEEDGHIKPLDDGSCIVKATTTLKEFNHYFHTRFSNEKYESIGAMLIKDFGYVPKRGEITKIKTLRFKILHSDNRRIYLMEVKRLKQPRFRKKII